MKRDFRIIATTFAFWLFGKGFGGGGDKRAMEILKRMHGKGVDINVITSKMGHNSYSKRFRTKYTVLPFPILDKLGILVSYVTRPIIACFSGFDFKKKDVLYSTSDFLSDVIPAFFWKKRNKGLKWVQTVHHIKKDGFLRTLAQRISFLFIRKHSDLIIVVNPLVKKNLLDLGFDEEKIKVNYNGVDPQKMEKYKPSTKGYACVYLGRLDVSKGIFDLIDIWDRVTKKMPKSTLAIIGSGEKKLEKRLKDSVIEKNLQKNIDILGFLEDKKAFGLLKSSKVFVLSSHEEGFGISILEAMECGKPCVVWDLPVYRSIYKKGMVRVREGDINAFAGEVTKLLKDKSLRNKISKDAKEQAGEYSWDKISKREEQLIKEVLSI